MIEVAGWYPPDLEKWNLNSTKPYLELYGETEPYLCANLAKTLPEVTLYFPLSGGWRVYEVVSTIRYLRPLPHQEDLVGKVAHYWQTVGPVVDSVAGFLAHLAGPASAMSSTLLHSLAKLPITALPPVEGLSWTVHRVTNRMGNEVMDGVQWKLPKKMFEVLGSRLSGSVAVYFHPSWQQQAGKVWSSLPEKQRECANESKPIQAKVVVHVPENQKIPVIECESDIELFIQPKDGDQTSS